MGPASPRKPSPSKVGEHRARTRVPEGHTPAFRSEAHRQSLAVATSAAEHDDQAFIDAVSVEFWRDRDA
jgi:hypothetical protein